MNAVSREILEKTMPRFQDLCIKLSELEQRECDELLNILFDLADDIIENIKER